MKVDAITADHMIVIAGDVSNYDATSLNCMQKKEVL